jgi:putative Ca2+/H+ antiporter (TMEM165/GDT1 family)
VIGAGILKATFFTEMGAKHTIAVVVVRTDHDGKQVYIGTSQADDPATIVSEVAERGARFPLNAAAKLPNSIPLAEL